MQHRVDLRDLVGSLVLNVILVLDLLEEPLHLRVDAAARRLIGSCLLDLLDPLDLLLRVQLPLLGQVLVLPPTTGLGVGVLSDLLGYLLPSRLLLVGPWSKLFWRTFE